MPARSAGLVQRCGFLGLFPKIQPCGLLYGFWIGNGNGDRVIAPAIMRAITRDRAREGIPVCFRLDFHIYFRLDSASHSAWSSTWNSARSYYAFPFGFRFRSLSFR